MSLRFLPGWRRPSWLPLLAATTALALASAPARADLNIVVESITTASSNAGTTGTFDVTLENTGPGAVSVGAFSFEISVPNSAPVTFTVATTATTTAPYIFDGNSGFGPVISTQVGQTLDASDLYTGPGTGATVGSGATVGLGNVAYTLTGTLTSPVTVSLSPYPGATSLTNGATGFDFGTHGDTTVVNLVNGQISPPQVTGVPEPATFGPAALGALAFAWSLARPRRRRCAGT